MIYKVVNSERAYKGLKYFDPFFKRDLLFGPFDKEIE